MPKRKVKDNVYEIKGVDHLFGVMPGNRMVSELVALAEITLPLKQPRRYFAPEAHQQLVLSIKKKGILSPLLVRPKVTGGYELVAGERRYRAAQEIGFEHVPVIVRDLSDVEATEVALLENLQRQDLNPLEETRGILELLSIKLSKSQEDIIAILNFASNHNVAATDNVIRSQEWTAVNEIFATVGRFTPESFRVNRLPLLKLPKDILQALETGKLEYTKAKAISRIKDEQLRKKILQSAIQEKLSLSGIKDRIAKLSLSTHRNKKDQTSEFKRRMDTAYTTLKKRKLWSDPKKKSKLENILQQLETLLAED